MTAIVISMLVILLLCAVVGAYVAWPHRGAPMPAVPRLGASMRRAVLSLPTVVALDDRQSVALDDRQTVGQTDRQSVGQTAAQPVAREARRD